MKILKILSFCCLLLLFYSFVGSRNPPVSLIGKTVNDFSLKNIDNKNISLDGFKAPEVLSSSSLAIIVRLPNYTPNASTRLTQNINQRAFRCWRLTRWTR